MDPARASRLLRGWLRVWGVIFALGAVDFLLLPGRTVAGLDQLARLLHLQAAPRLEQLSFWVPLAAAYMVLIAAFCYEGQRSARIPARPVRYLLLAKVASAASALGWFAFAGLLFPFLAAGVVDALIAAGTFVLLRAARPVLAA